MTRTRHERRAHYDQFVTQITDLCRNNGIRAALRSGRGRPPEQCPRMDRYLLHRTRGWGNKRAHYTIASLIALTRPEPAAPDDDGHSTTPPAASLSDDTPAPTDAPPPPTATHQTADSRPTDVDAAWRARPTWGTTLALAVRRHGFHPEHTENRLYTDGKLSAHLLQPRLPGLTDRLLRAGAQPDFAVLLEDLCWWDTDRARITERWRESFYLTLHRIDPDTDTEP